MPHSLRTKLSGLRYKKIISDKDYDRLCKALDNEGVLDKIRAEITEKENKLGCACVSDAALKYAYLEVLQIIDKYRQEG